MKELDIDQILKAMESPATATNLENILEMLKNADIVLKQVESVMDHLDRIGLKPLLVRGLGAKLGIDAESPLKTDGYKSPTHEKFITGVNNLSEAELLKQIGVGGNVKSDNS